MKSFNIKKVIEFTLLALFVFGFRVLIEESMPIFEAKLNLTFGKFLIKLLSNYPLTLSMLFLDIVIVYLVNRRNFPGKAFNKFFSLIVSSLLVALFSALWIRLPIWINGSETILFSDIYFTLTLFTSFVFNSVIFALLHVYYYYIKSHEKALNIEIGKKNRAYYQYQQLKGQMNPHFLFNSLNVLEFLIQTDPARASDFVRKLSSVYRYFLNKEDKEVVSLKEEIDFVMIYTDLLKARFDKGLEVRVEIDEKYYNFPIIPGGLQMLVENAIKHNVISNEHPLKIDISVKGSMVVTKNNLQLRINTMESSGVGIRNIRGQYKLLFKKEIQVFAEPGFFAIGLPLIETI